MAVDTVIMQHETKIPRNVSGGGEENCDRSSGSTTGGESQTNGSVDSGVEVNKIDSEADTLRNLSDS